MRHLPLKVLLLLLGAVAIVFSATYKGRDILTLFLGYAAYLEDALPLIARGIFLRRRMLRLLLVIVMSPVRRGRWHKRFVQTSGTALALWRAHRIPLAIAALFVSVVLVITGWKASTLPIFAPAVLLIVRWGWRHESARALRTLIERVGKALKTRAMRYSALRDIRKNYRDCEAYFLRFALGFKQKHSR
jgi:hypothetical protein